MTVDLLKMEIDENLPYWLSPEMDPKLIALREKIREKHRQKAKQGKSGNDKP